MIRYDFLNTINSIFIVMSGFMTHFLGGYDLTLKTLIFLVILDFISGTIKASFQKKISSSISFKGVISKILIFFVVALSFSIQNIINPHLPVREMTIFFFITSESISILENVSYFIEIPPFLKNMLEKGVNRNEKS